MRKPLFIHIPKAGGGSIHNHFRKYNPDLSENLHKCVSSYSKEYRDSCFVFTFTRNPYDRLVSAYFYLTTGRLRHEGDIHFGKTLSSNFREFVIKDLSNNLNWLHLRPQISWLDQSVDYIGRLENYKKDFDNICDMIGIPKTPLLHINKTTHKHYTEYYDDEIRDIVTGIYAEDIERLGYWFEE